MKIYGIYMPLVYKRVAGVWMGAQAHKKHEREQQAAAHQREEMAFSALSRLGIRWILHVKPGTYNTVTQVLHRGKLNQALERYLAKGSHKSQT